MRIEIAGIEKQNQKSTLRELAQAADSNHNGYIEETECIDFMRIAHEHGVSADKVKDVIGDFTEFQSSDENKKIEQELAELKAKEEELTAKQNSVSNPSNYYTKMKKLEELEQALTDIEQDMKKPDTTSKEPVESGFNKEMNKAGGIGGVLGALAGAVTGGVKGMGKGKLGILFGLLGAGIGAIAGASLGGVVAVGTTAQSAAREEGALNGYEVQIYQTIDTKGMLEEINQLRSELGLEPRKSESESV